MIREGMPLAHYVFLGETPDKVALKEVVSYLKRRFPIKRCMEWPTGVCSPRPTLTTLECFINVDLINILKRSNGPISVWIDGRCATVAMGRALFGDKVISKPGWKHKEIYCATREDIVRNPKFIRKEMFIIANGT